MALAALGVVYGDLGTSPLYAFRECVRPDAGGVPPTTAHVLGVLSLIFWALTLIVSLKYLTVVLQADNRGEGGILALLALLLERKKTETAAPTPRFDATAVAALLGIVGTALLLADGMITPAISVLSALEGLELAAPQLDAFVVPLTVAILIALFATQHLGTAWIARFFGPVMLVWFVMIALMGLPWIVRCPEVLAAVNPRHGLSLFLAHPGTAFFLLGAVVLCVTGAEALYADLGHFGKGPIRLAWYGVVFPSLLLNYFGQGALVIARGGDIVAPNAQGVPTTILIFFAMVPSALLYPVLIVSTLATVIASQALISGAYSLAEQAVQLDYWPRLAIVHTSGEMKGQIYVPFVNWTLMAACILLVIEFKTSSNLAAAYGIAVIGTMTITSVLLFQVIRACWGWPLAAAGALIGLFLAVDVPFLLANLGKVASGGWVPLLAAAALFTVMTTWRRGRAILDDPGNTESFRFPMKLFMAEVDRAAPKRDQETVVFLTSVADMVPMALMQLVERTHMLPGTLVLLTVRAEPLPRVRDDDAIQIRPYGQGCYGVTARHGFLERPAMARILALCSGAGLKLDINEVYFYLSRMTVTPTGRAPLAHWRKVLFAFMYHNARPATSFYSLPPNRVVELGRVIEM